MVAGVFVDGEVVDRAARVVDGSGEERAEGVGVEWLEAEQRRAGQQRPGEREVGVLGGGADEDEEALLRRGAASRVSCWVLG